MFSILCQWCPRERALGKTPKGVYRGLGGSFQGTFTFPWDIIDGVYCTVMYVRVLEMFNWCEFQTFSAQIYKTGTLESSVSNCPATLNGVQSFVFAHWQNILVHFLEVNASDGLLKYGHGRSNPLEVRVPKPNSIFWPSCSGSSGFGSETRKRTSFTSTFQNYYPVTNSKSKKLRFYPYLDQLHKVPELCLLISELFYSETWPVQNENTSIQYPVWFSNTEVSVSVFNLKNTE